MMDPMWMLVIGLVAGIAVSELGWFRWATRMLRKDCGNRCPNNQGEGK